MRDRGGIRRLNLNVGTRGVPLVAVKLPAPLHNNVSGLQVSGQFEATTTGPDVGVFTLVGAVLAVEAGDNVREELELGGILLRVDFGQSNCYRLVLLIRDRMILSRPANTKLSARLGDSLDTSVTTAFVLAIVGCRNWITHSLICSRFLTLFTIGASQGMAWVRVLVRPLIMAIGAIRVEFSKRLGF